MIFVVISRVSSFYADSPDISVSITLKHCVTNYPRYHIRYYVSFGPARIQHASLPGDMTQINL